MKLIQDFLNLLNMKLKLILFFIIFSFTNCNTTKGQFIRLIPRIPFTRINEQIEVDFFYDFGTNKNRFEAYIENAGKETFLDGSIKIKNNSKLNSEEIIGPFEFKVNDKILKSDSFKIKILEALPDTDKGI